MLIKPELFPKLLLSICLVFFIVGEVLISWRCAFGHWELSKPNTLYLLKFIIIIYLPCIFVFLTGSKNYLLIRWFLSILTGAIASFAFYIYLTIGLNV